MLSEFVNKIIGLNKLGSIDTESPDIFLRNNDQAIEDLEKFAPQRRHFRAAFTASTLQGFVDYINRRGVGRSLDHVFIAINPEKLHVRATFDSENKGHCLDTAELSLPLSPEYRRLLALGDSAKMNQRTAIEWVEDWNHALADSAKLLKGFRKIEAKRQADVKSETGNFKESASVMESVELANAELPETISFTCFPSDGLSSITCELRIKAHLDSVPLHFSLQPIQLDKVQESVANDFRDCLLDRLDGGNIHIGSMKF